MLELLFVEIRFLLQYALIAVLAFFAWRGGEAPERQIAIIFVAAVFAELLHPLFWPHDGSEHISYVHFVLDAVMFIAFAHVALRANRIYPLWIVAAQLIATLMHFQRAMIDQMHPLAYWALIRLPFYFQMLAFATGLWANRRRRKQGIRSRSWRLTSDR